MDLNCNNSIPVNYTTPESVSGGDTARLKTYYNTIFDKIFSNYEDERNAADANKDGTITTNEAKNWINRQNFENLIGNAKVILVRLGKELGVVENTNSNDVYGTASNLRRNFQDAITNFERIDTNNDGNVSDEELNYANETLPSNVTAKLNNARGIIDGVIDNVQGKYGSCWLLSTVRGLSKNAPELYNKIIQQDKETGEVTVTIQGRNGEPFVYKISKEELLKAREKAYNANYFDSGGRYNSTDIEAIAFEKAFQALELKESKEVLNEVKNYLDNSTWQKPQELNGKPLKDWLNASDAELESLNISDLTDFLYYSTPTDKTVAMPSTKAMDYNGNFAARNREIIKFIINNEFECNIDKNKLYDNATILRPMVEISSNGNSGSQVKTINKDHDLLKAYIKYSRPTNGAEKPDMAAIDSRDTVDVSAIRGGNSGKDIEVLLGSSVENKIIKNGTMNKKDLIQLMQEYTQNSNKLVRCSFNDNELGFQTNHSYLIEKITDEGIVILSNPHNSEKKERISINDFIKFNRELVFTSIPGELGI